MKSINPMNVIDESRIHSMHIWLIFWLFIVIAFDGYDAVIYGATVPSLIKEWGITDVTAGAIGSYAAIGTAIGAAFFGLLADKIGRKNIIIVTTILFSLFTCLAGFANGPVVFAIFRVIAGIGLGGVMPNVIAIDNRILTETSSNCYRIFCFLRIFNWSNGSGAYKSFPSYYSRMGACFLVSGNSIVIYPVFNEKYS